MSETTISLFDSFTLVPDPRSALGKRHPLNAILTLCSVAMLCGCRSLYAIAQFGRDRGKHFAAALGFTRQTTPCCTTLHYLFLALDKVAFENALARWSHAAAGAHGWTTVSLDGKTLRGSTDVQLPGVHLLAAYAHEAGIVLRQLPVDAKTNEHKAALEMLDLIPVKGKLIVGDAMFCQRDLSRKIRAKQGDYLWPVKDNQPDLLAAIEEAFDDADTSPSAAGVGCGGASDRPIRQ
jgi:DDE_Tnp_1-associated/Transposase DDE domain